MRGAVTTEPASHRTRGRLGTAALPSSRRWPDRWSPGISPLPVPWPTPGHCPTPRRSPRPTPCPGFGRAGARCGRGSRSPRGAVIVAGGALRRVPAGGRPRLLPSGWGIRMPMPDPVVVSRHCRLLSIEAFVVAPAAGLLGPATRGAERLIGRPDLRSALRRLAAHLPETNDGRPHGRWDAGYALRSMVMRSRPRIRRKWRMFAVPMRQPAAMPVAATRRSCAPMSFPVEASCAQIRA